MSESPHEILDIDKNASKDEIKKAYRKLAAKYHPDVNKEKDAEEKFKSITAAYESLENPKQEYTHSPAQGVAWVQSWTSSVKNIQKPPLQTSVQLTFSESVLGCKKTIQVSRFIKCDDCSGQGTFSTVDACPVCNGKGQQFVRRGPMTVIVQCNSCEGIGKKTEPCKTCKGEAGSFSERSFDVSILGGIQNDQVIRLGCGGHYQNSPFGEGYADAFIRVGVTPDPDMKLVGTNVISTLEITLLEALEGGLKEVKTVLGPQTIEIPKLSRHKDEIAKLGAGAVIHNHTGNHIFILDVKYPAATDVLVKSLKGGE